MRYLVGKEEWGLDSSGDYPGVALGHFLKPTNGNGSPVLSEAEGFWRLVD